MLIRQIYQFHAALPVQPRELSRKLHRVPMPPRSPKSMLAAVMTVVRATPRKLGHYRPSPAVIGVPAVVDEFPADSARLQVTDHRRRQVRANRLIIRRRL